MHLPRTFRHYTARAFKGPAYVESCCGPFFDFAIPTQHHQLEVATLKCANTCGRYHRIGSLCFIYWIGLMAYNLIQRTVRAKLTATKSGLPYHRRKPSHNITTRFFIDLFAQVQVIPVTTPDGQTTKHLAGFSDWVSKACAALGTEPSRFQPIGK